MNDASTPLPRGRILVVDDQRNMRATIALLLRAEGFTVREAATGEEALATLSCGWGDLLLTDLKMEPMDGLTLLQRAREVVPHLQVVVMTAFGSIESAVESMRLGAHDYIAKPFKVDELCQRVERALERAQPRKHPMSTDGEARLLQLEQDMFTAIRTRDRQGLERILDERFELRVPGKPPVDRATFIDGILSIPGTLVSVESADVRASIHGDVGVLTGRQHARVRLEDGTTVDDVQAFTDIALERDGQWRMVLAHSVPVSE